MIIAKEQASRIRSVREGEKTRGRLHQIRTDRRSKGASLSRRELPAFNRPIRRLRVSTPKKPAHHYQATEPIHDNPNLQNINIKNQCSAMLRVIPMTGRSGDFHYNSITGPTAISVRPPLRRVLPRPCAGSVTSCCHDRGSALYSRQGPQLSFTASVV